MCVGGAAEGLSMGDFCPGAREELSPSAQLRDLLGAMEMGGSIRKLCCAFSWRPLGLSKPALGTLQTLFLPLGHAVPSWCLSSDSGYLWPVILCGTVPVEAELENLAHFTFN